MDDPNEAARLKYLFKRNNCGTSNISPEMIFEGISHNPTTNIHSLEHLRHNIDLMARVVPVNIIADALNTEAMDQLDKKYDIRTLTDKDGDVIQYL